MPRRLIGCLAALAAASVLLTIAPAASAKTCRIGDSRSYGTTYVTKIKASGTSCRSARRVIRAFHDCRPGKSGRCTRRVRGYSCSEDRGPKGPTQYDSTVTCRKGDRKVVHNYTQWT